jgi:ureidoacrylate peracid hydrolase
MTLKLDATAVMVVDMQIDYCRKYGKTYAPEFEAAIGPIKALLAQARAKGVPVVYTKNWLNDPNGTWTKAHEQGWTAIPPHCIEGTEGAEIVDELKPKPEDYIIKKAAYSLFLGAYKRNAENIMTKFRNDHPKVDTFIVVGTDMNVCVFFNSDALHWCGYTVVLALDGIGGSPQFRTERGDVGYDHGLWFLSALNGAKVTTTQLITLI